MKLIALKYAYDLCEVDVREICQWEETHEKIENLSESNLESKSRSRTLSRVSCMTYAMPLSSHRGLRKSYTLSNIVCEEDGNK